MISRFSAVRRSMLSVTLLLIGVAALTVRPADGQVTTRLAANERLDPGSTIGAGFLAVSHDSERPAEFVLTAHRIRDDRVVATHRSSSFRVAPDRPFRLDERYLPGPRFYDGKVAGEIVMGPSPVPLASGERDPNVWWTRLQDQFITDWGEFRSLKEWRGRDALLLIVSPADARLRREAMGHPMLVRLETPRR